MLFKSVSPGDAAWEGNAGMGSLPHGDGARGGQAGTETRDLVTSNISPLLFPLSPKLTDLQNPQRRGRCATGSAITTGPGYAAGHIGSADAIAPFPNRLQPQQRRPLFSGGRKERAFITRRPFPSGTPQPLPIDSVGKQAASSDFQPCWRDAVQSKSSHSGGSSQPRGFSDV